MEDVKMINSNKVLTLTFSVLILFVILNNITFYDVAFTQTTNNNFVLLNKKLPDLFIKSIKLNKDCELEITIENLGPGLIPDIVWAQRSPKAPAIYLWINGKKWGGITIWRLDPQKQLKKPNSKIIYHPKVKVEGYKRVKVAIDIWNQVTETNEFNNSLSVKLHCPKDYPFANDLDKDEIPDELELELLRRFRPYYKFTKGENYIPTDPIYQIRYAQLLQNDWIEGLPKPRIEKNCAGGEDYHINPPRRLLYCLNKRLNLLFNHRKTNYYLNINDSKRKDPGNHKKKDWNFAIKRAPGLYGHVVKLNKLIKIEYWQYFAYNGQDLHAADHEGDWATVQLLYDPHTDKIVQTQHWAHGKGFKFDITKAIQIQKTFTVNSNFFFLKYLGPNNHQSLPEIKFSNQSRFPLRYQNRSVEFYVSKSKPKDLHVVVYIEKDAHEFWPFAEGSYQGANKHTGNGISYLTSFHTKRMNLGELYHPMPNPSPSRFKKEKEIILRFNGYWGAWHHLFNKPPPGPTLHCQWTFPKNEASIGAKIKRFCEH